MRINTSTLALPQRLLAVALVMVAMAALAVVASGNRPAYAAACTFSLNAGTYQVIEGGSADLTITRTGDCPTTETLGVDLTTGPAPAAPPSDYNNVVFVGDLFPAGSGSLAKVIHIATKSNIDPDGNRNFTATLHSPTVAGTVAVGNGTSTFTSAVVTIVDDDTPPKYTFAASTSTHNEGDGTVSITVNRIGAAGGTDKVTCSQSGGTASGGGVDYTFSSQTLTFAPGGSNSQVCNVTLVDDAGIADGGKTIVLQLAPVSGFSGGAGGYTSHTITITDNDGAGTLAFTSATYSVPESAGVASFGIVRTGGQTGTVTATCKTTGGTATANVDYTELSVGQVLTWNNNDTSTKYCQVGILTDTLVEGPETFGLQITGNVAGQTTATVTIEDDDGTGQIVFSSISYTGLENGGPITITVNRTGGTGGGSVTYATSAGPAPSATAGVDYTATSGILSWATGDLTPKTFIVAPINDSLIEGAKNVTLTLSSPTGGLTLGTPSTAVLTITDDESPFPTISSIVPASGTILGGTPVTITGVNFTGATSVTFGGFACGSIVVVNATTITCVTPAHTGGVVDVIVNTPAGPSGTSGIANDYTYTGGPTITSLNPATGQASGNTIVTITGTNFTQNGTTVKFDGVVAVFTFIDAQTLIAASPPHSAGTVRVSVTTPGGTTPDTAADDFTYTGASMPAVTALSPTSGPVGTTVIITGSGFTGANLVTFGGVSATYTVNNDGQVTASVPAGTAAGTVDVRVTTPSGTSANTANDDFNNTSNAPTVTYTLFFRFTLIVWTGQNNVSALQVLRGLESPDNPATNSVLGLVGAIWRFDASTQTFKGYFPGSDGVPGANDFTTLQSGVGYFIALINPGTVSWTVPAN